MLTNATRKNAPSRARFLLTGLSSTYKIIAIARSPAHVSISPARPARNSVSEPRILPAVSGPQVLAGGGGGAARHDEAAPDVGLGEEGDHDDKQIDQPAGPRVRLRR